MAHRFNITAFAILVIIFFSVQPARAQESYAVSLNPLFGMVHGHAEELVYPSGDTKAPLLSELLWDMKPLLYYGFLLNLSQVNPRERWGFFADFSLKFGIPGMSGDMEDRDWQSVENADLTDFSKHDNHTRDLFFFDISGGLSYPLRRAMLLKGFVNVSFMRFSFVGMDGYGIYAYQHTENGEGTGIYDPINASTANKPVFNGKVISYTQEWLIIAPGVSFGYFLHPNFLTELTFLVSPLIFCVDLDEHKERKNQYRDTMQGGLLIEPGVRLSVAATKWIGISGEFSWRHISGTKGITYQRNPIGTGIWTKGGSAGAGLSIINAALMLTVRL